MSRPKAHFLHPGKTGGTAVNASLIKHASDGDYDLVFHEHRTGLGDIPVGDKVFFTYRDPISKFVSAFYARFQNGELAFGDGVWKPHVAIHYERFPTPNAVAEALSSDDLELRMNAVAMLTQVDHVGNSYWGWFRGESYFLSRIEDILWFCRQDRLSEDFAILLEKLGLPPTIELVTARTALERNPKGSLDKHLSETARCNLEVWFGRDERFVYVCEQVRERLLRAG